MFDDNCSLDNKVDMQVFVINSSLIVDIQGPVVQSMVSLTSSSLRGQLIKCFATL